MTTASSSEAPAGDHPTGASAYLRRRAELLARPELSAEQRMRGLSDAADAWLRRLLAQSRGTAGSVALVAVGGYGRRELVAGSDLDVLVLHDGRRADAEVADLADAVLYPLWDAGVPVDHSFRTVAEARAVSDRDVKAALGLIDARVVAGDDGLGGELRAGVLADWRRAAARRLPELAELSRDRANRAGELAFLLEPDLMDSHGGLRDTLVLRAVAASWLTDMPHAGVEDARGRLMEVRDALHRSSGRRSDRLLLQEQDAVADLLGLADADVLLGEVSRAGRTLAYALDLTWRAVDRALRPPRTGGRRGPGVPRAGGVLADGVLEHDGEVVLAPDARLERDPVLPLRAAAAAAQAGLPLAPHTAARLAHAPPLPEPWPAAARDALVALLGAGRAALPVWEALEDAGLVVGWLPEWAAVRHRAQRNALHRHTVDRHSVETAVEAARLARSVPRPDLLLLAALLHDLGKGVAGDHSATGAELAEGIGRRMGLEPEDVEVLTRLVRLHLLLPVVATRRDLDDPATVRAVADQVGSRSLLDLLAALTEADAVAAGPVTWTPWRARLVLDLVARTRAQLAGEPLPRPPGLEPWQEDLVLAGLPTVVTESAATSAALAGAPGGARITVVSPDRPGLLASVAGVLVLHRLDARSVTAQTRDGTAVQVWQVVSVRGDRPDAVRLRDDVLRALDGRLDVAARVAARAVPQQRARLPGVAPRVDVADGATDRATVIEVRAHDAPGLLHRLTSALAGERISIRTAVVGTLGAEVVDAFYVVDHRGRPLSSDRASHVVATLRAVAGT